MNNIQLIVVAVLIAMLGYQVWASIYVYRAAEYDVKQRAAQLMIIWLAPVIGAALCHLFLRNSRRYESRSDLDFVPQSPNDAGPEV